MGGASGLGFLEWDVAAIGTLINHFGRIYLYTPANPPSATTFIVFQTSGSPRFSFQWETNGKMSIVGADGVSVWATTTSVVALNQWNRLEWHANHAADSIELKLFQIMDSTTPTETLGPVVSGGVIGADANDFTINPSILSFTFWFDDIVVGAAAYPGPITSAALVVPGPPVLGGRFHM